MSQTRHISPRAQSHSQLQTVPAAGDSSTDRLPRTLRLRAEDNRTAPQANQRGRSTRRIKWSEDVVDNEGMGKKSSKVCCIYHKSRPVGESSSESSSSSDSDSDSSDADSGCDNDHRHDHNHVGGPSRHALPDPSADPPREASGQPLPSDQLASCCQRHRADAAKKQRRTRSPNAYEKMPKTARRHG